MAIDVSSVKSNVSGDSPFQPAKGSAGNSDINFADLMRKSGARLGNGLMAISDNAGISSITDKSDDAARYDNHQQAPVDSNAETYDSSDHDSNHDARPADQAASSHRDDRAPDQAAGTDPDYSEPTGETSTDASSAHGDDGSGEPDDTSSDAATANDDQAPDDTANSESDGGDSTGQSAHSSEKAAEHVANGGDNAAAGHGKGTGSNAEQILSSLLASAQGNTQTGKAADSASQSAQNAGPGENAVKGLTNALDNVTKNTGETAATTDTGAQGKAGASATAKDGFNLHASQTALGKAANTAQSANAAANAPGQATAAEATGKETAAQQSAQLSKMVGDGPKVSVTVGTINESASVISKPMTSLTSSAALIAENNAQNGRGHESQNSAGGNGGQAQSGAAQAQTNAGQIQVSTAQAAAQNQVNVSGGGDAKGPMLAAQHAGSTGPVAAGSGEGVAVTGNVNTTPQAQSAASAQASNAPRHALPGQALTDQVSVQITKAVNAGADKISIHLKPADLGRIDVKLEVGHDGRVSAIVTADNKNTLDLLQKDSRELQQALQNAGLQMDNDSLSFNLRERGEDAQTAGSDVGDDGSESPDADENGLADQLAAHTQDIISDTRVDIRA